ncbi:TPA: DUF4238 domain-containing protein [Stenotrophomonas maltophilia]
MSALAKKKNHYIWSFHLQRWATAGKDIWHLTSRGNAAHDSVAGLARSDYFYKAGSLSPRQTALIRLCIEQCDAGVRQFHHRKLDQWLTIQRHVELIGGSALAKHPEFLAAKLAEECNFIEDMHARIENAARPVLVALEEGTVDVLANNQALLRILSYVGHLAFRTRAFREDIQNRMAKKVTQPDAADADACRWFLDFMYGMNTGHSLYECRGQTTQSLLRTTAAFPFIISDRPALNVHPSFARDGLPPVHLDLVVPLSPTLALAVSESNQYQSGEQLLSGAEVDRLNILQASQAAYAIYASRKEDIERYRRYVPAHQRG